MRVVWTRPALADVLQIKEYLAADSPRYAQRVAERLFAAVERLSEYPLSGRMVPELNEQTVREVSSTRHIASCIVCARMCWQSLPSCTPLGDSRPMLCAHFPERIAVPQPNKPFQQTADLLNARVARLCFTRLQLNGRR